MSTRFRAISAFVVIVFAFIFFGFVNYLAARQNATSEERIAALRAEVELLRRREAHGDRTGTAGRRPSPPHVDDGRREPRRDRRGREARAVGGDGTAAADAASRAPEQLRRAEFVRRPAARATTAPPAISARATSSPSSTPSSRSDRTASPIRGGSQSIKINYKGRALTARIVDAGDARAEVDPGDWAIVRVNEPIDLPALNVNLEYSFDFADPIFRLGNDYSKGIILSTGYVGQRTPGNLVTCLTDGHPGVSGGGVSESRWRSRRDSDRPDAGGLSLLVHPAAPRGDAPQSEVRPSAIRNFTPPASGPRLRRSSSSFFLISASRPRSVGS